MDAHESEAMRRARELITLWGLTQYAAAQQTGLTRGAISKSSWYRQFIKDKKNALLSK